MRRLQSLALALAMQGCAPRPAEPAQTPVSSPSSIPSETAPAAQPAVTGSVAVASLSGQWRLAGIDGAAFGESIGIALTGSDRELWWEPRCAGIARSYRIEGFAVHFAPALAARPPGSPAGPVCAIGLPPRLRDVVRALDAATTVERTAQNGILISGGGHSLTLFSQ